MSTNSSQSPLTVSIERVLARLHTAVIVSVALTPELPLVVQYDATNHFELFVVACSERDRWSIELIGVEQNTKPND